jgi:hypothetical protein
MPSLARTSSLLLLFSLGITFSAAEPKESGWLGGGRLESGCTQNHVHVSTLLPPHALSSLILPSSINVTVGTPAQELSLQVDTGSSDLWVPAVDSNACTSKTGYPDGAYNYKASSSFFQLTNGGFNISYDSPGDSDSGFYFMTF